MTSTAKPTTFYGAVQMLERWVRIPTLSDHVVLENDIAEIMGRTAEALVHAPEERRQAARRIVGESISKLGP